MNHGSPNSSKQIKSPPLVIIERAKKAARYKNVQRDCSNFQLCEDSKLSVQLVHFTYHGRLGIRSDQAAIYMHK